MAMSAKYFIKNSQGKEFYSWFADSSAKWAVVLSHYLGNDYQPFLLTESQARIQDKLKKDFNQVSTYQLKSEDFTPQFSAQAMNLAHPDEQGSYKMRYLFTPYNGPTHAIACIKNEQWHVRFMDPNIGELSFISLDEFEN